MPRYIDAEKAIRAIKNRESADSFDFNEGLIAAMNAIDDVPDADVEEVRHGRWIEDGDVQICSECGEEHEWADYRAPYCDICGAKMDGKVSENAEIH